jgi:hypothetical protein
MTFLKALSAPFSVSSACALRAASTKRLDCSASVKVDEPSFCFGARLAGPDISSPLVGGSAIDNPTITGFPHGPLTAVGAGLCGLFAQFGLKLSNALFQRGDAFRQLEDVGSAVFYPIKSLFAHPNFNGCSHG